MLINYNTKELEMCARLMRAEALSDGELAMLMVGNVIVNRAIANCLDFKNIRSITDVVTQNPGGFSGYNSSLYNSGSATTKEKELAKRVLKGEYYYPATNALWFYNPGKSECKTTWFNQNNSGRYKSHCFYVPKNGVCNELY